MKGKKATYFKDVAKKVCSLLGLAAGRLEGGPNGDVKLTLSVSEGNPADVRETFDVLSKELDSTEIMWERLSRLGATVTGTAPLKRGRMRR